MGRYVGKNDTLLKNRVEEGISETVFLNLIPEVPVVLPNMSLEVAPSYRSYNTDEMPYEPEEVVTIGKSIIPLAEIQTDYKDQINYRSSCLPLRVARANLLFSIYSKNGRSKDNPFNSSHDDHYPLHRDK